VCTLEFENNRELYDWFIDALDLPEPRPRQYEFARLALTYNLMSKRKLLALVEGGHVDGWDDPRMPTVSGMRRLGYTPAAIRAFCDRIGVAKANSLVDVALLEHAVRDDLNRNSPRAMGVLRPLRLILDTYEGTEEFELPSSPPGADPVTRSVPFSAELYIDHEDFEEVPPPGFRRLAPGREVRLRGAYFVTCTGVDKDASGRISAVHCSHDPATRGGDAPDGRKVAATLHWVDGPTSVQAEIRVYDRLFASPTPEQGPEGSTFLDRLNPDSLRTVQGRLEASLASVGVDARLQLERVGYFRVDEDSAPGRLVLNRTISLRDARVKAPKPVRRPETKAPAGPQSTQGTKATDAVDADPALAAVRDAAVVAGADPTAATNFVANELRRALGDADPDPTLGPALAALLALQADGVVSGKASRRVLRVLVDEGGDPAAIVDRLGLRQVSDAAALTPIVQQVLANHPEEAARLKAGEGKLMGFLMGRVMRASRGKADPKAAAALIRSLLDA
jgi:glutaminyl-tRNA synthetase